MSLQNQFSQAADLPDAPLGPHGETALHLAAQQGDVGAAKAALAAGATAHAKDELNNTALIYAALRGDAEMIALLLRHDASEAGYMGNAGTALNAASGIGSIRAVEALLEFGADIDGANASGTTPLMTAVFNRDHAMAEYLLKKGANALAAKDNGQTALHLAAINGDAAMIGLLLQNGAAPALHMAARPTLQLPLHHAAYGGNYEAVEILLRYGSPVNELNNMDRTALHYVAATDNCALARLLVEGGPADMRAGGLLTPLHVAAADGKFSMVKELVRLGADPYVKDAQGRTPLHVAAWAGHLEAVKYFMEEISPGHREAALQSRAAALYDAVFYAHDEVVKYLAAKDKEALNAQNPSGFTALIAAALQTETPFVLPLLDAGANPDVADRQGRTPLGIAAQRRNLKLARMLVSYGADVNARCGRDGTALIEAAGTGDRAMVEFLLAKGANPHLKSDSGWTALGIAAREGKTNVVPLLEKALQEFKEPAANPAVKPQP